MYWNGKVDSLQGTKLVKILIYQKMHQLRVLENVISYKKTPMGAHVDRAPKMAMIEILYCRLLIIRTRGNQNPFSKWLLVGLVDSDCESESILCGLIQHGLTSPISTIKKRVRLLVRVQLNRVHYILQYCENCHRSNAKKWKNK